MGLKVKTDGYSSEASSLSDAGVVNIQLSSAEADDKIKLDEFGNEIQHQDGATFTMKNGDVHEYADIWHVKHDYDSTEVTYDAKKGVGVSEAFEKSSSISILCLLNT